MSRETQTEDFELRLLKMEHDIGQIREALLETREIAVLKSQTLPHIMHQFKLLQFQIFAQNQSLAEVEEECSLRYTSFELAMRGRATAKEDARTIRKYLNTALRRFKETRETVVRLTREKATLEQQVEAYKLASEAMDTVLTEIRGLLEGAETPEEMVRELRKIVAETPRPQIVEQPPQEDPFLGQ